MILADFRATPEGKAGEPAEGVVLGRPVRFNDDDDVLDARAQDRLRRAAEAVVSDVSFQYEPIAAALAYEAIVSAEELGHVDKGRDPELCGGEA